MTAHGCDRTRCWRVEGPTGSREGSDDEHAGGDVDGGTTAAGTAPDEQHVTFERFYTAHAGRLVGQLYLVAGSMDEARDCVQEAFARAWVHWENLRHQNTEPVGWVYTVAYRIIMSRWRRSQAQRRALHRHGQPPPEPPPSADAVAVARALAALPAGQRAVIVLHYYQDLPVDEIARALGLSPSGVKSRLMRARAALAPLLADGDPSANHPSRPEVPRA